MEQNNLIFCFDGTSNDPNDAGDFYNDTSISNVLKLHLLLGGTLDDDSSGVIPRQKSFYYSGVGTRGNIVKQIVNSLIAPSWGDRKDILNEATKDLSKHYTVGCKVYVFGFSRGAAIARIFAAKIKRFCPKVECVDFLGVFDTVAAIGGSLDLSKDTMPASGILFENGTIGKYIKYAVHLVSLDENRTAFQPTLFNRDNRVEEVWFAGVHSDIGGGFWFDGLSDITLKFMCDKIQKKGDLSILHPSEIGYSGYVMEAGICHDDIDIYPLSTGLIHENKRSAVYKKITLSTRHIRVNEGDKPSANYMPIVHHSVRDRFNKVAGYRPSALRNVDYRIMEENGTIENVTRTGVRGLREILQRSVAEKDLHRFPRTNNLQSHPPVV